MPVAPKRLFSRRLSIYKIGKTACRKLVLENHYSGRCPGIKYCFGLLEASRVVGCVVFSIPASYTLCRGVCGEDYQGCVLELSRLVILTRRKNAASFFLGGVLKQLPNAIVVSYADCNQHVGHVGYIYQATNWLYTGHGNAEPLWRHPVTGEIVSYTRRHIDEKAEKLGIDWTGLVKEKQVGKHRYITFCGDKQFRKKARASLRYAVMPYPKGKTRRHIGNVMRTVFDS